MKIESEENDGTWYIQSTQNKDEMVDLKNEKEILDKQD
jgi:hypothetical protein